jgi:hypothetical protein
MLTPRSGGKPGRIAALKRFVEYAECKVRDKDAYVHVVESSRGMYGSRRERK